MSQTTADPVPSAMPEEPPADGRDDLQPHTGDLHVQSSPCNIHGQAGHICEDVAATHTFSPWDLLLRSPASPKPASRVCPSRCPQALIIPKVHPPPMGSEDLKCSFPVEKFKECYTHFQFKAWLFHLKTGPFVPRPRGKTYSWQTDGQDR